MEEPTFKQLMNEVDKLKEAAQEKSESPYDTESEIKDDSDSDLKLMPDDELRSVSEFEASDSDDTHDLEVSQSEHISQDENASAERLTLVTTALIEQLPGRFSATLKECLPSIIKESLQTHIPASERFVNLQNELSKVLKSEMGRSVTSKVHLDIQEEQQPDPHTTNDHHDSSVNEDITLVLHKKANMGITEDDSDYDDLDKQPMSKRFKFMTLIPNIPTPTPLSSFFAEPLRKPVQQLKMVQEFIDQLFGTTSSRFSLTPLKEPTLPRDTSKGKEVTTEEPKNELVAYME
nr:hypothetical protein [Tanacetum cinerariifolium]